MLEIILNHINYKVKQHTISKNKEYNRMSLWEEHVFQKNNIQMNLRMYFFKVLEDFRFDREQTMLKFVNNKKNTF